MLHCLRCTLWFHQKQTKSSKFPEELQGCIFPVSSLEAGTPSFPSVFLSVLRWCYLRKKWFPVGWYFVECEHFIWFSPTQSWFASSFLYSPIQAFPSEWLFALEWLLSTVNTCICRSQINHISLIRLNFIVKQEENLHFFPLRNARKTTSHIYHTQLCSLRLNPFFVSHGQFGIMNSFSVFGLWEIHTVTGKMCKFHTERPQVWTRNFLAVR